MVDDVSKFRELLSAIADQIILHEDMTRHPRNTEDFKKVAQKDADESFLLYTGVIVHTVENLVRRLENLDRRLKVLEAKNRP
jgi:hypothetical protein